MTSAIVGGMTEVKISLSPMGTGRIELDGHEIQNAVAGFTLNANAGDATTMLVRLSAVALSYVGSVDVKMPDSTRQLLVAAGWTPPVEPVRDELPEAIVTAIEESRAARANLVTTVQDAEGLPDNHRCQLYGHTTALGQLRALVKRLDLS